MILALPQTRAAAAPRSAGFGLLPAVLVAVSCCLLNGCHHRVPSPAVAAPPPVAEVLPEMVSVPPPTHPTEPLPTVATEPIAPPPINTGSSHRRSRTPRKPTPPSAAQTVPPPSPPQQVAAATPPPVNLGQLSAGGEANSSLRQQTTDLMRAQTQRVNSLPAAVVSSHTADVEQAKSFLKKAQEAFTASDVEGAHTLATKAKVILDDLLK